MSAIIEKVRKLLATAADSGATPHEAAVALRLAQRMMFQHRISDQDLATAAQRHAHATGNVRAADMFVDVLGPLVDATCDGTLALAVGDVCSVGVYSSRDAGVMKVYGLPVDVAVARELYVFVRERCAAESKAWCKPRGLRSNTVAARSFRRGFAEGLREHTRSEKTARLASTETLQIDTAAGIGALVVVEGAVARQHEAALQEKRGDLGLRRMPNRRVRDDAVANAAGRAAGSSVNLSKNVLR